MRFFYSEKTLPQPGNESNPVLTAVSKYMKSIDMGDYNPDFPDVNWNPRDESNCIQKLLNVSDHLEGVDIPNSPNSSVPHIAHLLASLTILKESYGVAPGEKLKTLRDMGILTLVKAGMPGPCMVYIDAFLNSESGCDNISKIGLLSGVISDLKDERRLGKYGALNYAVLFVALEQWFSLIDTLEPAKKALFADEQTSYMTLKAKASFVKVMANMTFIDQCIVNVWKKLDIHTDLDVPTASQMSKQAL